MNFNDVYNTPGTYAVTIPANYAVRASLWGAGGSGGYGQNFKMPYAGGSGGYVSCVVNALPGSTIYLLVGQGGQATSGFPSVTTNTIGAGGMSYSSSS